MRYEIDFDDETVILDGRKYSFETIREIADYIENNERWFSFFKSQEVKTYE